MFTKEEAKKIFEEVQANHKRLDECAGPHDFQDDLSSRVGTLVRRQKCSKCGGSIDALDSIWYRRGLEHGAKMVKSAAQEVEP